MTSSARSMPRFPPALVPLSLVLALAAPASAQDVVKRVGNVSFVADAGLAFPGGLFVVRLLSRTGLGASWAILDGRRAAFYQGARGPRALVPVPVGSTSGKNVIGIEIMARKGRQRVPMDVTVGERSYPPRLFRVPEPRRPLVESPQAQHDGRVLLGLLRTETPGLVPAGALKPPVTAPGAGFGSLLTYEGASALESLLDSTWGEMHRGLDYEVPPGTAVLAPGP